MKAIGLARILDCGQLVPGAGLVAVIELHAPAGSFAPITMLRIHFMQPWLSNAAMAEALHDVSMWLEFAGLDSGVTCMPDEPTIRLSRLSFFRDAQAAFVYCPTCLLD